MNNASRQSIVSPLVYLMEERRIMLSGLCQPPQMLLGGWILNRLPVELHAEAARRVPHPLLEKLDNPSAGEVDPSDWIRQRSKWTTARAMNKFRLRVIDLGLASTHNVDAVIYDMPLAVFRDVSRGFAVSRVDFRPKTA
jgi:hypothetical protein